MFFTSGSQQALQSPQALSWSGAGQVRLFVETVDVLGQLMTGPWSTIGEEKRITRLSGLLSRWSLIQASLVGIQCRLLGVALQTSYILFRWSRSWTSPESCHLKTSGFFELIKVVIASTQYGFFKASSLLYWAFYTVLNLYIPFRA